MFWLIKRGFENDPKYRELCSNIVRFGINHMFCNVIPFSEEVNSDYPLDEIKEPVFNYGSYNLSRIVKRMGLQPGAFISENISLNNLLQHYGSEMFNSDMRFGTIKDIELDNEVKTFFIRPMEDSKSFTARVLNIEDFNYFKSNILNLGEEYSTIRPDTMVTICSPKIIDQEIRFFIIDGKVSTYSTYKIGERVVYSPEVDPYIIDYVTNVIKIYEPDLAFCLDIAVSNGQPKILEINSINSAGLYAIDTQKFISDIENLTQYYI